MQQQYVITFAGADRTGLVETLANLVISQGGDWQQSELTRLSGAFAGAILITLPPEGLTTLSEAVEQHRSEQLSVQMMPATARVTPEPNLHLTLVGPDRPGIVYEVTRELNDSDINILKFSSRVESAAWSGGNIFVAELATHAPSSLDISDLRGRLDRIENKMTLEIDIESQAD